MSDPSDPIGRLNAALEGRYKIERQIGEGGMATVYLATDLRHEREVALKVLKPELAAVVGGERFLAEIKTTANLKHPHILPLFDSGQADSFLFYVMPYVEGESLRDRINRDKQLPVDEAVAIARKVAGALQHAHEHGVIHRDIKPGNILFQDNEPVVTDFGIALAAGVAGGTRLTETGLSVGTPLYMSPEQATGDQGMGPQSDTYSLACVLYEMLIGDPPYQGSTAQAVLGQIIAGDAVSATKKRASIPANVDAAIRKALEKLPADRFTSAQDFSQALGDAGFRHGELDPTGVASASRLWNPPSMALGALAVLFAVTTAWSLLRPAPPVPTRRFAIGLPETGSRVTGNLQSLAITADGEAIIVNVVPLEGQSQLYLRPLGDLEMAPIRGTESATSFFISPDGEWVGFNALDETFKKVPVAGGPPTTIIDTPGSRGGFRGADWGDAGTIIYATRDYPGLMRVPDVGGIPERITTPDSAIANQEFHLQPHFLPGSEAVLFVVRRQGEPDQIAALSLESGQYDLLTIGNWPHYVSDGFLVFQRGNALFAAAFDPTQLALRNEPVSIVEGVAGGRRYFALSSDGTLVLAPGSESNVVPVWVDRDGSEQPLDPTLTGLFAMPTFSPDGRRVAFQRQAEAEPEDIWVYDLDQETFTRLTFGGGSNLGPFWSPDGSEIGFSSNREGQFALYSRPADLSSEERLLFAEEGANLFNAQWTPDGRRLVYRRVGPTTSGAADLWHVAPDPDSIPVVFLETRYLEYSPALSPDGRWLAYSSDESGEFEVYVRPFPGPGGQSQVSVNGGENPAWSESGREIFYLTQDQSLTVATVRTEPSFAVESRERLLAWPYFRQERLRHYAPAPDDQRFMTVGSSISAQSLTLVQNFFDELRQLAP